MKRTNQPPPPPPSGPWMDRPASSRRPGSRPDAIPEPEGLPRPTDSAPTPHVPWVPGMPGPPPGWGGAGTSSARMLADAPISSSSPSPRGLEAAMRDQIMSGLSGHHAAAPPSGAPRPDPTGQRSDAWRANPPSYPSQPTPPSVSGAREVRAEREPESVRIDRPAPADERMPLSYVIASALFLAIAVVGFGVWLAFAVISL